MGNQQSKTENVNNTQNMTQKKCICDGYLIECNAKDLYNGNIVSCDGCYKDCDDNEKIFHCPDEQNNIHPDGYDICSKCSEKNIKSPSNTAILSLRQLGYGQDSSVQALQESNGDLKKAMVLLNNAKLQLNAIKMSNDQNNKISTGNDKKTHGIDNSVDQLVQNGYSFSKSCKALAAANGDTNIAMKYLLTKIPKENDKILPQTAVDKLIKMGFTSRMALYGLQLSNGNINVAAQIIQEIKKNSLCVGDIASCPHLKSLIEIINADTNNELIDDQIDNQKILNDFYHLLFQHPTNDDFEFIYNIIQKCNIKKCMKIRRRNRIQIDNDNDDVKVNDNNDKCIDGNNKNIDDIYTAKRQILDQMHCHYSHSIEIGHRLTKDEQNIINNINNGDDKKEFQVINEQIVEKHKLLTVKHKLYQDITSSSQRNTKFNQLTDKLPNKLATSQIRTYSFGHKFYYWDLNDNKDDQDDIDDIYKELKKRIYIAPKYNSLKQELIDNDICSINISEWKSENDKATDKRDTDHAKSIKAEPGGVIQSTQFVTVSDYGINAGDPIDLHHLISIAVYCNYDTLSFKFSRTFRKLNASESDKSLNKRHSHFHYLSKYIHEAVNVFGTETMSNGLVCGYRTFYHGINTNMLFDKMTCYINQPFSTTSIYEVAMTFTYKTGILLEIKPGIKTKYFECSWLSDFSDENELLFIGSYDAVTFENVINVVSGNEYKIYIQCLSIIDKMMDGSYYSNDNGECSERFFQEWLTNKQAKPDPLLYGAKPISLMHKYLIIKMINHELNRKYPAKYDKYLNIPSYIEQLFHYICINKSFVTIDMISMNEEITKDIMETKMGFCGYLFLKYLIYDNGIINFNLINSLYPNAVEIEIKDLDIISETMVDIICNFLHTGTTKIVKIILQLSEKSSHSVSASTFRTLDVIYKFETIGYDIAVGDSAIQILKILNIK